MSAIWEKNMNAEQLAVIRHDSGPLQVVAQAGSGKTRAAVHRVARIVSEGTDPSRIFMVTFSRAGAGEMDNRLRQLGISQVNVQTWHAFCLRVLKADQLPQGTWSPDDKDKAKTMVKKAIGYQHENWEGANLTRVRRFIGYCKANLFEFDSEDADKLAKKMFGASGPRAVRVASIAQGLIEDAMILTFDDMLVYVARHFIENEDRRREWAARFDYVITDEAQDNSLVQVVLQEALSRDHRNIMVVGDLAQAIFSFRGSKPDYLAEFQGKWEAERIAMSRNYRSAQRIVDVANEIIRPAKFRQPEDMIAAREGAGHGLVEVVACEDLEDEARELAAMVKREIEGGRSPGEICVLYRLNAQSRALEEELLRQKLPYVIVGGTNFYERKEVKDLLGYLRVATGNDPDGDAFKRCINAPFRFLGAKFVERAMGIHVDQPGLVWDQVVTQAAQQTGIQRRQVESVQGWLSIIAQIQAAMTEEEEEEIDEAADEEVLALKSRPETILLALLKSTRYIEWLEKEEGEESIETSHGANVRELLRVSKQFSTVKELLSYIDQQVVAATRNKRSRERDVVVLMTVHRSKGLEWPIVWVVGCNDKVLPHAKGDIEEERRLMYVAVTRARDCLYLSYVRELAMKSGVNSLDPSEFLTPEVMQIATRKATVNASHGYVADDALEDPHDISEYEPVSLPGAEEHEPESSPRVWLGPEARCTLCGDLLSKHDDETCALLFAGTESKASGQ